MITKEPLPQLPLWVKKHQCPRAQEAGWLCLRRKNKLLPSTVFHWGARATGWHPLTLVRVSFFLNSIDINALCGQTVCYGLTLNSLTSSDYLFSSRFRKWGPAGRNMTPEAGFGGRKLGYLLLSHSLYPSPSRSWWSLPHVPITRVLTTQYTILPHQDGLKPSETFDPNKSFILQVVSVRYCENETK